MGLVANLERIWEGADSEFLVHESGNLRFSDIMSQTSLNLSEINEGQVVALVGDFDSRSIRTFLQLIEKKTIVVPLTKDNRRQHDYYFGEALVDFVIEGTSIKRVANEKVSPLLQELRNKKHPGLVLFSSGTTGKPKAILHDFEIFLKKFETPRPSLKTLNFLLFDHIGGLNTLFHTLFNKGVIVAPKSRRVEDVLTICQEENVQVLPTTPTFLRMLLMSGMIPRRFPKSLEIVTYGTERMDQPTLSALCELLPRVDFRQTYGMSELGILRVKSESRDSLFMKVGGEGVETRTTEGVLEIRSDSRMLGYLNASSPFDSDGWYNTKDLVIERNGMYKITGRSSEVINVGGLKFMASDVESVALSFDGVDLAKAIGRSNPITGQHVELQVQPAADGQFDTRGLQDFLEANLPSHMIPRKITLSEIAVSHRFKKE